MISCGADQPLSQNAAYLARIRELVRQLVPALGETTVCGIASHAHGAPPELVAATLRSLPDMGTKAASRNVNLLRRKPETFLDSAPAVAEAIHLLPDPHPADYDWRFTSGTILDLTGMALRVASAPRKISVLGAKTIFIQLAESSIDEVKLFDRSLSQLEDLRALGYSDGLVDHDLFDAVPSWAERFNVVIADPPWYPEYYSAFILRASEMLEPGGRLLISLLPPLTRPSALTDRIHLLSFARVCGLIVEDTLDEFLRYETPPFERNVLALSGLDCRDWRAADLCVLRKEGPNSKVYLSAPPEEPKWDDFRLGRKKIKVRRRTEQSPARFDFRPADPRGPLLRSVSRRSPHRSRIDVWTSDNIAYSVDRLSVVSEVLAHSVHMTLGKAVEAVTASRGLSLGEAAAVGEFLRRLRE